jgi:phage baseplate assembly protein gpV
MDPQRVTFPDKQPYEGVVVDRSDPRELGRVRVRIDGHWEPYGPWCFVVGEKFGGADGLGNSSSPPIGADVLVFFVNGNAENPRVLAGHFGLNETPDKAALTDDGDNKVFQDERVCIEVDAREGTYGVRVTDRESDGGVVSVEVDMASGQVGVDTALGIVLSSSATVRINAPLVKINDRLVLPRGKPI